MRDAGEANEEPAPKVALAREKVLEEARRAIAEGEKKDVSIVVIGQYSLACVLALPKLTVSCIGHVDAGKSTLMGRLLYELGEVGEKGRIANERASGKIGKASFSWAWQMDGLTEERERGITMDISQTRLPLPRTTLTVLDAPGHRDFIPNMISGAAQADAALLVIDAGVGEFEAGFEGGGQSREHVLLVRSLGVTQVVVAVNKLDMVEWSKARFDEICGALQPFLVQSGFQPSKTIFIPCGAFSGVNLQERNCKALEAWYNGPTLVDALDNLTPPTRSLDTPLRFPISNVFKGGHLSLGGIGVSGRVCSGIVQAREVVRILPGQLSATIHSIELDSKSVPWAAAGSNVTLYLSGIDPNFLSIGSVICSPNDLVPVASAFIAQIIVFDIKMPITTGASVELFHHSRDNPATISKLLATVDRASGAVIKSNPRVLTKGCSARVEITLRSGTMSAPSTKPLFLPLETFSTNKEMGRVLLRRGGETIAAGETTNIFFFSPGASNAPISRG
ncbi:hypothetical protein BOTBODRAFT_109754 [Botryobasidium botryosum FD-172 SS1]|uniref:Elongation factor 1 alpha-like protein n=1 Tax=Botryobasidium botryosum (strain FD-172 SS1) TaxID=930990 RepID=A0A067MT75_BOTB1|nr:hypothetical protein BOTBODRAFT_109754 [Botryobasidium botryosum FD-172 SS1]